MAQISSLSDLANKLSGGSSGTPNNLFFWKDTSVDGATATSPVYGRWSSMWRYGGFPSGGAAPGSSPAVPTRATAGALQQPDPGGMRELFMTGFSMTTLAAAQAIVIYDRLFHVGGLSGATGTAQDVSGFGPCGRYTAETRGGSDSCFGNMLFVEIETTIGSSTINATVEYLDQDDTPQTSPVFQLGGTGLREAQRMIPVPLVAGTGIRDFNNLDLEFSTGSAGSINLVIARPLCLISTTQVGQCSLNDLITNDPSIVRVLPGACLAFMYLATSTSVQSFFGQIQLVES